MLLTPDHIVNTDKTWIAGKSVILTKGLYIVFLQSQFLCYGAISEPLHTQCTYLLFLLICHK